MFDPALEGYWGSRSVDVAMETCLSLITTYAASIEGIKISLLNASYEEAMRAPLPSSVVSSPVMISTTQTLLRKTGGIIRTRCLAYSTRSRPLLRRLSRGWAAGDRTGYDSLMSPTVPLSRRIFETPTQYYKAGVVFLAWLNGFQDHFTMVGEMQSARTILHYADIFRFADDAGLLRDPDLAVSRMTALCTVHGVT